MYDTQIITIIIDFQCNSGKHRIDIGEYRVFCIDRGNRVYYIIIQ